MRIALMTDSYFPTRDGVVTAVVTMRQALEELGHTVFIIAPDPGEEHREEGVHYFRSIRFKRYPEYLIPIFPSNKRELIRSLNVDVIHIFGIAFMALKGLMVSRSTKVPSVMTYCTNVVDAMGFYSPLPLPIDIQERLAWIYLRNLLRRPKCVIALTPATISEFELKKVRTKSTEIIPVGIDISRFKDGIDGSFVTERHALVGKRVAIHVGRVSFEKNISLVVKAMALLPDDVALLIVGRGPASDSLKELVEREGLSKKVIFTGFVPDEELPSYYAASDIVVSASRFETQGLTIIEAMACGTPAACSNGRAFLDIIQDGVNGCLFEDSPESCADAMLRCLNGKDMLSKNSRGTAEEYSMESVGRKLEKAYGKIIK